MTSPSRTYKVRFTGDSSDLTRASKQADDDLTKVQNTVGNLNKVAMAASAAVLIGIGAFVAQGAASLIEIERLNAQTTQAIKSTGAAWAKTDELVAYSEKIEKLTGIEHEQVQQGQNLLLTFTNIRNEVGAGNDVFTQATDILVDMSVAMGTDVKTSAIQLGKALNDPIKGITALTKVGVTFNEQQREQIKRMTEAGDVAGAQKIILAELNREFGGSAAAFGETTAGELAKLKNAFGDVQEELATAFAPALQTVFDKLSGLATWARDNPDIFKNIVLGVGGLATAVLAANVAIDAYKVAVDLAKAAQWAWNAALLANPLGVVLLAIAAIIVGIGLIMAGFGFDWGEFWDKAKKKVEDTWNDITGASDQAGAFLRAIPDQIGNAFASIGAKIANPFIAAFNKVSMAWNATIGSLGGVKLPAALGGATIGLPKLGTASYLAKGGRAQAGMPYVVGEVGPELFVPGQDGTVVPNSALTGDIYVAVQVGNEPIAAVARAERIEAGKETRRWVRAANASTVGAAA